MSTMQNKGKLPATQDQDEAMLTGPSSSESPAAPLASPAGQPISLKAWNAAREEQDRTQPQRKKRAPNRSKEVIQADKDAKEARKAQREAKKAAQVDGEGAKKSAKPRGRIARVTSGDDEGDEQPSTEQSRRQRRAPSTGDLNDLKQARQQKVAQTSTTVPSTSSARDHDRLSNSESEAILEELGVPPDERYGTMQKYSVEQQKELRGVKELMLMDCAQRLRDAGFPDLEDQVQIFFRNLYDGDELARVPQDKRYMNGDGSITKVYEGEKVWLALNQMSPRRSPLSLGVSYQEDGSFKATIRGQLDLEHYGDVDFMADDRQPGSTEDRPETNEHTAQRTETDESEKDETGQLATPDTASDAAATQEEGEPATMPVSSSNLKRRRSDDLEDESVTPAPNKSKAELSKSGRHKPMSVEQQTARLQFLRGRMALFENVRQQAVAGRGESDREASADDLREGSERDHEEFLGNNGESFEEESEEESEEE